MGSVAGSGGVHIKRYNMTAKIKENVDVMCERTFMLFSWKQFSLTVERFLKEVVM